MENIPPIIITLLIIIAAFLIPIFLIKVTHSWSHKNPHLVKTSFRTKDNSDISLYIERNWKLSDGRVFYPATNGLYGCDGSKLITVGQLINLLKKDIKGSYDLDNIKISKSATIVTALITFHTYYNPYTKSS
jgi:hypothetical protein